MSEPKTHVRALVVEALVDWPPGSAQRWPGWPQLKAQPHGEVTPARVVVTLDLMEEASAHDRALEALKELGHRWAFIRGTVRDRDVETQAAGLVHEALERASYDSRA
ncbi:MAG: hypothetical protein KAT70_08080 [Thermoplasmata archaeon]|nr:hypothetical protein [Thermoplasmata archaeon]